MRKICLAGLCVVFGFLPNAQADGPAAVAPQTSATLMLLWTPQSQFAGYYVARAKGFYQHRGVNVTLIRGGPDRDQVAYLKSGQTDFALLWLTTALTAWNEGTPVRHLGQIVNRSNLALVGWKQRGIHTVKDLDQRRISVWGGPFLPAFTSYFRTHGVTPEILPQHYSINLFLRHGVDACSVMRYNEYHVLYQYGIDPDALTTFFLSDGETPLPEEGIYCLNPLFREKPAVCRAIMEASMAGWRYAADHPEEALDIVMEEVREGHIPTNRAHMRWMLRAMLESIFPAQPGDWTPGRLSRETYRSTVTMLKHVGLTGAAPSLETFTAQEECLRVP